MGRGGGGDIGHTGKQPWCVVDSEVLADLVSWQMDQEEEENKSSS